MNERHLIIRHEANAGLDHVTGDIAGVAAAFTDRTVWIPNIQRLARVHSADNVIRWSDLYDISRFPRHVRVFEDGEAPKADRELQVPYSTPLAKVKERVASEAATVSVALRMTYIANAARNAFERHAAEGIVRLADAAARALGAFSMIHMRMTDKVTEKACEKRWFDESVVIEAIRLLIPPGSRVYLMTNQPDARRSFPLLFGAYDLVTCDDIPVLASLRQTNYVLYQVEKTLLGRARVAIANVRCTSPNQIALADLLPKASALPTRGAGTPQTQNAPPLSAVLGLYRGGTSCVAGVLYHLGLQMGMSFDPPDRHNPRGYFEPQWLKEQLRRICDEPGLGAMAPRAERVELLRKWLIGQVPYAGANGRGIGLKHPLLCLLGDDLIEAWGPHVRLIAVYRPLADSVRSLQRASWWPADVCAAVQQKLWDARENFLRRHAHLRIDYRQLLASPRAHVEQIAAFLGIKPTEAHLAATVAFIDPTLDSSARSGNTGGPHGPAHEEEKRETPKRRVRLVVAVVSARKYADRRARCRRLWTHKFASADVVWRFFVGRGEAGCCEDAEPDLVTLDCDDDYQHLPQKMGAAFRWVMERYEFAHLFKCDDDTYVEVDRLLAYEPPAEYCGWSISKSFPGGPDYASGGAGYMLSPRAAGIACDLLTRHRTGAEDDVVGRALKSAGIPLHHEARFRWSAQAGRVPAPSNDIITAHWVNNAAAEEVVRRPWLVKGAARTSPDDVVLKVGSRVIRWVIGSAHDRAFTDRVLLPWATPDAERLPAETKADFTVGVFLGSASQIERVADGPGMRFILVGEPETRLSDIGDCYQIVQQPRPEDGDRVRYAPMLCIWSPPMDAPEKTRPCSVIDSGRWQWRFNEFETLRATVADADGYGAAYKRPLDGYHCIGPDPRVFSKFEGLREYAFSGAIERTAAEDYVTEKFSDPILCEAVPIYRGCPNIEEYAVPGCYVPFQEAGSIDWRNWHSEYQKRRPAVLRQKELIRKYFNVLGYFITLTGRLELLDQKRPLTSKWAFRWPV